MVQFSHNIPNAVNRQGRGTSPLQPTAYAEAPLKTPLFDRGAIGLHNTSDLPSLATRAEVNMDSEAVPTSLLEFNKNVHGTVCVTFTWRIYTRRDWQLLLFREVVVSRFFMAATKSSRTTPSTML